MFFDFSYTPRISIMASMMITLMSKSQAIIAWYIPYCKKDMLKRAAIPYKASLRPMSYTAYILMSFLKKEVMATKT